MMKKKGSQRWLITQKSHQGSKHVTLLLFLNDASVRRDAPIENLWLKANAFTGGEIFLS